MTAAALAMPHTQPLGFALLAPPAPAVPTPGAPAAGMTLTAGNCVALTAALIQAACQRGQWEDASAAARIGLDLAQPRSPHGAMLQALAHALPLLMCAPDEHRLYMLRDADGQQLGLLRLRSNGRISSPDPELAAHHAHWVLQDGCLLLASADGTPHTRFALCGEQAGDADLPNPVPNPVPNPIHHGTAPLLNKPAATPAKRLYLGLSLASGTPRLLQELNCTYTRLRLLDAELAGPFCGLYNVDAMVPAALPARAVLLLASPHSGAAALAEVLNQHASLHIDGELLGQSGIGLAEGCVAPQDAGVLGTLRTMDPTWFVCMMLGRSHDRAGRDLAGLPVRGFTLAAVHSAAVLDWALGQSGLRIVHMARSNLLAEFADMLAHRQPHQDQHQHQHRDQHLPTPARASTPMPSPPLHFDAERFTRFVEMKQFYLAALRARLVQRNADTVEVDGSRLNGATLAELRGFLTDQAPLPAQVDEGIRLSHGPLVDRFDNPEAVRTCLAMIGQAHWAHAEGMLPATG